MRGQRPRTTTYARATGPCPPPPPAGQDLGQDAAEARGADNATACRGRARPSCRRRCDQTYLQRAPDRAHRARGGEARRHMAGTRYGDGAVPGSTHCPARLMTFQTGVACPSLRAHDAAVRGLFCARRAQSSRLRARARHIERTGGTSCLLHGTHVSGAEEPTALPNLFGARHVGPGRGDSARPMDVDCPDVGAG